MEKLEIYNKLRAVPTEAQKSIQGGRLKGMTDINPMWRIKALTETFGACGFGWKYTIDKQWIEQGANGELAAFCNITLYVNIDGAWGEGIPGTGGSMFVAKEKSGPYTSDECFKMALTDAISVACKALGAGADIYWNKDRTKYDQPEEPAKPAEPKPTDPVSEKIAARIAKGLSAICSDPKDQKYMLESFCGGKYHEPSEVTYADAQHIIDELLAQYERQRADKEAASEN